MRNVVMGTLLFMGVLFAALPAASVDAACDPDATNCCGGVATSILACDQPGGDEADYKDTGLWGILILTINVLIVGVGVLALAGIVWGAILYTSAGGNSEQVKKAMGIFTNVVIGVVAFAGMWVLLNFLIPGGAFTQL